MNKLVSIIMPAYNVGRYIEESIKSVQNQTYTDWELLVINDGSTDDTQRVVRKFAEHDSRIRLYNQENKGVSSARNKGLSMAVGEYVAFLDGDDMWDSHFLSELITAKEHSKADLVYCGYARIYDNGFCRRYPYKYINGRILLDNIKRMVWIHIGAILVDKSLLVDNKIMFTDGCLIGEDQEVIMKILSVATVQAVPKELLLYRRRDESAITSQWKWQKHIHAIYGYKRAAKFIIDRYAHSPEIKELKTALYNELAFKLYKFLWRMVRRGCHEDALRIMNDPEFREDLGKINVGRLRWLDRMRYRAIMSQNKHLWNFCTVFRNM